MGASVSSCCLLHLFLSQGESRDQTFPHPLDQNRACRDFFVPPTYPSHHNRTIPCICFVLLNICTRWTIIATVGPRPRYPLQGAGDQGGRTSTGSRWEMACLQAGGGHSLSPLYWTSTGCLELLDALQEQLLPLCHGPWTCCVEKGCRGERSIFPSAPSRVIFGEQRQHTCALHSLRAMIAVNCDEEETKALPMSSCPLRLMAAALPAETPACPTGHRNAPGQHTWGHNAPEKFLS